MRNLPKSVNLWLLISAILVVGILAVYSLRDPVHPASVPVGEAARVDPPPPERVPTPAVGIAEPPTTAAPNRRELGSPLAKRLNAPDSDAAGDLAALQGMLRQYFRVLKRRQGLPVGNDTDLARVLTGHNPMKLVILPGSHPAVSPEGRLLDRFGTPYFIHPLGRLVFEIRSAGPDHRLFTADDIVQVPGSAPHALDGIPDDPEFASP